MFEDIVVLGSVCHSLNDASNDQYIWKLRSIELRGEIEFHNLYREYIYSDAFKNAKRSYVDNISGKAFKHRCLRQLNAKKNLCKKGYKPHTMKLVGHKDTIRGLHCLGNYALSGSEDNQVMLWDLEHKKGHKYSEHMNWVTQVLLLDDYAISGAADRAVWVRPINLEGETASTYKHDGWVTGISKLSETKIVTCGDGGKLIAYDCKEKQNLHTCTAHDGGIKKMCQNENMICTYSDTESKVIIRDINTFDVLGSLSNDVGAPAARSQYNMVLNEIGTMALTKSNLLITGETKTVKIWDTRI